MTTKWGDGTGSWWWTVDSGQWTSHYRSLLYFTFYDSIVPLAGPDWAGVTREVQQLMISGILFVIILTAHRVGV